MMESKNYLIIGGTSGVGKQLVADLLQQGHNVWTSGRDLSKIDLHRNLTAFAYDVLNPMQLPDNLPNSLDGLAYCPGTILLKPFKNISGDELSEHFDVNVRGAVNIIQQTIPRLKEGERSAIVLFSSVAVSIGMNFHSLVAIVKGSIEGLTRALAAELAPSIRVNCIAPSITNTPLAEKFTNTPEKVEAAAKRHPLQRMGTTQDIAQLAQYLLTPNSDWMTGQIIHLDGGFSTIKQ